MRKQFALLLPLLLLAVPALAETFPLDIEFGYRFTTIDGNEDVYRSQINEEEGFLLRNFNYYGTDTTGEAKLADTFRITASDLGSGPSSLMRIDLGRADMYKFRFNYQKMDAYNALPAFANPLLSQGIVPGQHTMDRTRKMFDAELEFMPGKPISFQLGYGQNNYEGPGTSTYFVGQDEFRVTQDIDDTEQEMRAGLSLNYPRLWGNITQGWRSYAGNESMKLAYGAGGGNNTGTILGKPVTADGITLTGRTRRGHAVHEPVPVGAADGPADADGVVRDVVGGERLRGSGNDDGLVHRVRHRKLLRGAQPGSEHERRERHVARAVARRVRSGGRDRSACGVPD